MKLDNLVKEGEEIVYSEFNFKPEQTKFKKYSKKEWINFLKKGNLELTAGGVYFPRTLSAHLKNSKYLPINLFHEYFGHGNYCEHSMPGKELVSLENNLEDIELKILKEKEIIKNTQVKIDKDSPLAKEYLGARKNLEDFLKKNIFTYEGFAIWMEHYLAKKTNKENLFEEKLNSIVHPAFKETFEKMNDFSQDKGNLAFIGEIGLPKHYDDEMLVDLLKRKYKGNFDSIQLAIVYGSQKPHSDIDFFIVSDKINPEYNKWLDLFVISRKELEEKLKVLSIDVTDPLFSGRAIINPNYHEKLKIDVLREKITEKAIKYNFTKSDEQGNFALTYPENSRERRIGLKYQESYKRNAQNLKEGVKILTLK